MFPVAPTSAKRFVSPNGSRRTTLSGPSGVAAAQVRAHRILDLPYLARRELAQEEPRAVAEGEVEALLGEQQWGPAGADVGHDDGDDRAFVDGDPRGRGVPLHTQHGALPARDQAGDQRQDEQQHADPADVGEAETPPGRGQRRT
jgi:hypothetical protein